MDIVKDLSKLIGDCTDNEIDFKDLYYELIYLRDKYSKQLTLTDVVASVLCTKSNYILGVTKDIEYTLMEESDEFYIIINDLGYKGGYLKEDFVKSTMK